MLRIIRLYADMTGEFEVIQTDAPDKVIEKQLYENMLKLENLEQVDKDAYTFIKSQGYIVKVLGNEDDFDLKEVKGFADAEFNICDYLD